ncbi:hypothetical protein QFC22_002069 [Naganishia vaughanmartiniae]|uniref:Uncharacterized protein n=1 Tax=Naganishia vaughanmartiniae TaxID=1424756 RepID=A0ACC2XCB0_9TREE|nr:hypothetical protein QFC22_002069 [Naganishia vaughanmartiniae]
MTSPRNVVAVIGTTGVGKSQYAISLANSPVLQHAHIRPTVLSSDSMQLYEGLPVITNKVTEEEKDGVEHWGLGIVKPGGGGSWEVGKWCLEAWDKIESMNPMNEIPIICGGTHYYAQHLLFPPARLSLDRSQTDVTASKSKNTKWRPRHSLDEILNTLDQTDEHSKCVADRIRSEPGVREYLDTFYLPDPIFPAPWNEPSSPSSLSDQQLLAQHRLLVLVDESEAGRWHWRDGRKVKRGLERWWENVETVRRAREGKAGEFDGVEEQAQELSRPRLRTLMFWVYDDLESLTPRLDRRVDKMVDLGLVDEIKELRELAIRIYGTEDAIDHQEGIFQSIGFKEFSHIPTNRLVPTNPLFAPALDRMKISTRQYAKRQLQWIRKQLLPVVKQALEHQRAEGEGEDAGPWIYVVRGGDDDVALGEEILRCFLNHEPMPDYRIVGHPKAEELLRILAETGEGSEGVDTQHSLAVVPDIQQRQVLNARVECNVCSIPGQPVTIIKSEWLAHLKSKSHRRSQARLARERGTGPDYTKIREEAARRKAVKEEEMRTAQLQREQDNDVGV